MSWAGLDGGFRTRPVAPMHVLTMTRTLLSTRAPRALLTALLLVLAVWPAASNAEGSGRLRSLEGDEVLMPSAAGRDALSSRAGVTGAALGARSLLALRVYYTGEGWPAVTDPSMAHYSVDQVRSRLTGAPTSASEMFREQSAGAVSFKGLTGPQADVSDWLSFSGPLPRDATGECDADAIANAAFTEAGKTLPLASYDHVMIIFPLVSPRGDCPWAGLGQVPGRVTWINGLYANEAVIDGAIAAHELSHNLGIRHAASLACTAPSAADATRAVLTSTGCTLPTSSVDATRVAPVVEYGDPFDMMGTFGYDFPWAGTELLSTWHRAQLLQLPESDQRTITTAGTYELAAADAASGTRLLRIPRGTGSAGIAELSLEYRPGGALFDRWDLDPVVVPPAGGVLARLTPTVATSARSYLLDATPETGQQYAAQGGQAFVGAWRDAGLAPGRSLLDQASGILITVRAAGPQAATIELSGGPLDAAPTVTTPGPTPTPTAAPTPSPTPALPVGGVTAGGGAGAAVGGSAAGGAGGSGAGTVLLGAPRLAWPGVRRGTVRLTVSRRVIVEWPGAARITAAVSGRWLSSRSGTRATFRLPRWAARTATVRLRAVTADGDAARTATLRVRRGQLTLLAD